ncbi:hypothetical protein COL94_28730 [Bacillus wiedmannii]|uniref:hypothetical protein n=1 Tax=Bacillus wiedmannii TaxID=1890302 RepID=UPI000BFA4BA2|nr:hypothetical protein [Bacillus wiedmannii]PGA79604.1 hypothetical protein COL94_28730 [Bacillus wiedmannii]
MDQCPTCNTFWVSCPCCDIRFCPDCRTEEDEEEPESDEERKERTEFVRKKFAEYLERKKE